MYSWSKMYKGFRREGFVHSLKKWYIMSDLRFGEHIGTDKFGNKYFEDTGDHVPYGRDRWVEYKAKNYDASQVPPEWHSWLHHISDTPLSAVPKYHIDHKPNLSGTSWAYSPNNFVFHKGSTLTERALTEHAQTEQTKVEEPVEIHSKSHNKK